MKIGQSLPLAHQRWTLVESFERDGASFVLLRREPAERWAARLSARERQVLEGLAAGATTKEVAFELGLAISTVAVLLMRARRKLGVRTRSELVARGQALRTEEPAMNRGDD
jgi:DNA-binding CsgD family transcriptional regulator